MNYFRITAYHPQEDISVILDSNGRFEKLWEFSAHLLQKGFKIIEVSKEDAFEEGSLPKISASNKIILRAVQAGPPSIEQGRVTMENQYYIVKI